MRRAIAVGALFVGVSLLTAESLSAQWSLSLAGAGVFPIGDYGEYANTGWGLGGNVGYAVSQNVSVHAGGFYGSNSHEEDGDKTNLVGFGGDLIYGFINQGGAAPFFFAGTGSLGHQFKSDAFPDEEDTSWQAYIDAGAGIGLPLGSVQGYIGGQYVYGFDETTFFALFTGISIPLGGDP